MAPQVTRGGAALMLDPPARIHTPIRALGPSELQEALGDLTPDGLLASIATESDLSLWLPMQGDSPAPPGSVECHSRGERSGAALALCRVPALSVGAADAMDLLIGMKRPAAGAAPTTFDYWRTLAHYALSLLARQQFAPSVERVGPDRYQGRWIAQVVDPGELEWLDRFASVMPAMCRCLDTTDRWERDPVRLIDDFLMSICEAVIRRSLDGDEFYREFHERAASERKWEVAWIASLVGDRRTLSWPVEDADEIASQIRDWAALRVSEFPHTRHELGFTLIEPVSADPADSLIDVPSGAAGDETDESRSESIASPLESDQTGPVPTEDLDERWRIRIDYRAADQDESFDVEKILREPIQERSILSARLSSRGAHLRAELARASRILPDLRGLLEGRITDELTLNTGEAHRFIRDQAPMLLADGFNVDLPEWAQTRNHRFGLELVVRPQANRSIDEELSLGTFGLTSMIEFDWRIAIGDERISPAEFELLAARGSPLVRLRGQWIDMDQIAAEKARNFLQQRGSGHVTLAQALRLSAGLDEAETGLPIVGLTGASWLEQLLNRLPETRLDRLSQPTEFNGTMRPYQVRGLEWLTFLNRLGLGACLADDMGLGKTIQLIALLLHERRLQPDVGPTLLFVPMSVVGNWQREIQRFARRIRTLVHHGPERLTGDSFVDAARKHDVIITTYGLAHRDSRILSRVQWHRIALDEAQKIKNPSAHQTIAIRSLPAAHRLALTGTPLENHLSELWSIMETLNPGLLGSAAQFRKQFAIPIERLGDQQRAEQLRRMIRPFILRRLKNDPTIECDLPEKMEMRVFCNLTPEQAALYRETVQQMLTEIDQAAGIRRRGLILATLTRLKQICNHPAHFLKDNSPQLEGRSGKCERIVEMLEEVLEEGDAALIFTQYRVMGELLRQMFEERLRARTFFMHGGTPAKQRDALVEEFQNPNGDVRLFLISLKAGGFGLNLTRANHVFHFDRWWNPAVEQQATDRAHRIGQSRRVQVHKFVCIGTIEDRIDKLLTEKSALADHIVGSGDEWLTGLTTSELREYLALSSEAVAES
ncbi:MAG: DEAD/DEAH box helicase [Phycisphaerae bacterium]|nr:DEAD/DEAH box helicase [Phycisphaerae bacterium]